MITAAHALIYAKKAEETRAFFRDVLGLKSVDAGDGWLIFKLPPAELGIHPAHEDRHHELYFMCDDLQKTIAELSAKGVEFSGKIEDEPWGTVTSFKLPSGELVGLYEPKHKTAYDLP